MMLGQLCGEHEVEDSGSSSDSSDAGISYSDSEEQLSALDSSSDNNFSRYNFGNEIVDKARIKSGFSGTGGKECGFPFT